MTATIAFPFAFDSLGGTAECDEATHIRDMIEQLLLTRPGERVNRPEFGSGLLQAVFAPNSAEIATALEFTTRAALHRYLGDVIEVETLQLRADDAALRVDLAYVVRASGERRSETIDLGERP